MIQRRSMQASYRRLRVSLTAEVRAAKRQASSRVTLFKARFATWQARSGVGPRIGKLFRVRSLGSGYLEGCGVDGGDEGHGVEFGAVVDVVFEAGVDDVEGAGAETQRCAEVGSDAGEGVVGEPGGVGEGEVGAVGGLHEGEEDGSRAEDVFEGEFAVGAGADEEGVAVVEVGEECFSGGGGVEEAGDEEGFGGAGAVSGAGAVGGGEEDGCCRRLFR